MTLRRNETDVAFESYVCVRGDVIDNAAYLLLNVLANRDDEYEWDIRAIREVVEEAERVLESQGIIACDPFWCEENGERTPCYKTGDCDGKCPFKKGASQ